MGAWVHCKAGAGEDRLGWGKAARGRAHLTQHCGGALRYVVAAGCPPRLTPTMPCCRPSRLLRPGGIFLLISLGAPSARLALLQKLGLWQDVQVSRDGGCTAHVPMCRCVLLPRLLTHTPHRHARTHPCTLDTSRLHAVDWMPRTASLSCLLGIVEAPGFPDTGAHTLFYLYRLLR